MNIPFKMPTLSTQPEPKKCNSLNHLPAKNNTKTSDARRKKQSMKSTKIKMLIAAKISHELQKTIIKTSRKVSFELDETKIKLNNRVILNSIVNCL